jgi:ABC-type transporter Mla subunit MlaD
VPAAINYFFDSTPKEADKEIVKKVVTVFGNAAMDTVSGVADVSSTIEAVMQQRDDMRDAIYGWGSWGDWGSSIYSNRWPQQEKQASKALPPTTNTTNTASTQVNVVAGGVGAGDVGAG